MADVSWQLGILATLWPERVARLDSRNRTYIVLANAITGRGYVRKSQISLNTLV